MSCEIFYSTSKRVTSTAQDLMNDLAEKWDGWADITESDGQVTELWVSESLYFYINVASLTLKHSLRGTNSGINLSGTSVVGSYVIVVTDKGLMWHTAANAAQSFVIAKAGDDYGVALDSNPNGANWNVYSEGMQNTLSQARTAGSSYNSMFLTQLVDIIPEGDTVTFDGAYFVFLRPNQFTTGKYIMGGKNYYINAYSQLALEYTE